MYAPTYLHFYQYIFIRPIWITEFNNLKNNFFVELECDCLNKTWLLEDFTANQYSGKIINQILAYLICPPYPSLLKWEKSI